MEKQFFCLLIQVGDVDTLPSL